MLSTLSFKLVNGIGGDPAVYVQPNQSSDCILFDAGSLDSLSNKDLLRVRVLAVSHTHLDHFIRFDRLLRVNVPHFRTLEIVGPSGILSNLKGKLSAYTWNLLENSQLNFIVHEVMPDGSASAFRLTNSNNFEPTPLDTYKAQEIATQDQPCVVRLMSLSNVKLSAVSVDHGIQVLAYSLTMPPSQVVSRTSLEQLALKPGPWITDLQKKSASKDLDGKIDVYGEEYSVKELALKLINSRPGEKLIYATDMIFSQKNLDSLVSLAGDGVDLLICESNFLTKDREKAIKKFHMTTYQAALIAANLRAKYLQIFHVSNVYAEDYTTAVSEAADAFSNLRQCDPNELKSRLSTEFVLPAQKSVSFAT